MIGDLTRGAAAGAVATLPMSAVMVAAQRLGRMGEQPPAAITDAALDAADADAVRATEAARNTAVTVAHLGFGAGCGALFALAARWLPPSMRVRAPAGAVFGAGVWAVSYAGWVPALGILPPPDEDRADRQVTMLAAHLVYGATLGALLRRAR